MLRSHIALPLASAVTAGLMALASSASAQSTITISMAAPAAAPRLRGPSVFGAYPASPLLFAVPATGQVPLTFSASGLPNGIAIAPETGIISGTTPALGSYPIEVTATSAAGSASATYTLVSGGTLALTPPMGWNSYDSFGASVTEQEMLDEADAMRTQLQPFGWNQVVIDYRWYEPGQPIDANGRYLPATSKYPSAIADNGLKSLADQIHAKGLAFGIHIMRGIPRKSFDANLPIAGSSYRTNEAGNPSDPCPWDDHMWGVRGDTEAGKAWYDALFAQYASWGVDFVKIDDMLNNDTRVFHQAEADAIRQAVAKTGRSIALSLSPGPNDPSWLPNASPNLNTNANMWRIVNDFWDYNALTDLPGVFRAADAWQAVSGLTPGHWPDLDMLPLGYLGPRNEWHASGDTTFTKNEQVTILSLWAMLPSPLMFGGNPARLVSDPWTLALLTNEEVLAVHQDVGGARGGRTVVPGGELWQRALSGGRKAVGFFNRGTQDALMSASLSSLGFTSPPKIRDLWHRSDVTTLTQSLDASVPGGAALLYVLSPALTATGGTDGSGSGAGNGGGLAVGGAAGTTDATNATSGVAQGSAGTGGVAPDGAGTGDVAAGNARGGAAATAADDGAGVNSSSAPVGNSDHSGCALARRAGGSWALALVALAAAMTSRRRSRRY